MLGRVAQEVKGLPVKRGVARLARVGMCLHQGPGFGGRFQNGIGSGGAQFGLDQAA
jgi:hypothetical protein